MHHFQKYQMMFSPVIQSFIQNFKEQISINLNWSQFFFYIKVKVQKLASDFVIKKNDFFDPSLNIRYVVNNYSSRACLNRLQSIIDMCMFLYAMNKVHKFWLLFAHHICRLDKVIEYLPAYLVLKHVFTKVGRSELSSQGAPGVPWHLQILSDHLTLSQPRGTDYAHLLLFTIGTHGFSDNPTAL